MVVPTARRGIPPDRVAQTSDRAAPTAWAGRFGLSLRRFLPWSVVGSAAWSCYVLAVGMALGPLTGGNPLLNLLAGGVMAVVTGVARAPVPLLVGRYCRHG